VTDRLALRRFTAAETRDGGDFVGWFGLRPVRPSEAAIIDWADAAPSTGAA
jgi:hypothetical protein